MAEQTKEEKCLIEARDFIDRATKTVSQGWPSVVSDVKFNSATTMIGDIAAEKYQDCMTPQVLPNVQPATRDRGNTQAKPKRNFR